MTPPADGDGRPGPRPADEARAALRRAVSARRTAPRGTDDSAAGAGPAGVGSAGAGPAGVGKGLAGDGPARDGLAGAGNGWDGNGQTGDGQTGDGQTGDGPAGDGPAGNGPAGNGPAGNGPAGNGPAGNGPSGDGPAPGSSARAREVKPDGLPLREPRRPVGASRTDRTDSPVPPARRTAGDRPGARPGDAAREALRAALREARQTRAGDTAGETGSTSRPSRPGPSAPLSPSVPSVPSAPRARNTSRTEDAVRARAVRELLKDAFRMPPETDHAGEAPAPAGEAPAPAAGSPGLPGLPEPPAGSPAGASRQPEPSGPSGPPPGCTSSAPPAPPQVPPSMAAPGRDGEHRRTFPAFPARTTADGGFAETWWGNAWVTALEEAAPDPERLARGRGYAERGHVDAITVTPGLVLAYVRGSRPRPYRVQLRLRTLDDAAWERFLDTAAERPGHIAALLDKELPPSLADCGVPLLPGPGDLAPHCNCPDSGHPCKHAAALCYQTARLLDADPFVLLLLRGRGERELIDALSRLSAARAARAARSGQPAPLPGVRASEVLTPRRLPPLPAPLPAPPHPEQLPVYPAAPGGPDPFALDQLATDAAARAHALLTTGRDPVGGLTLWQDAVRLAAARPGSGLTAATRALYASLAAATGRTTADLARAVAAWRQGGLEGLTVLEEPWDPPAGRFDRARPLLLAADLPAFRPWRNRLTHPLGHVQLRLGRDGLWYAYESEPGREDWWPRGTPDLDPVGALTGLGAPGGPS
ncbi:SWIM zinc finger family protein [Streptomyces sp. NPDC006134]|uniref:SWIM zinc finger family protein n=1 Tax=Streptomyces sp. NPDC006134 TaxID=3154467 RepID=UPI0033EA3143